jgi:hypothetical protein
MLTNTDENLQKSFFNEIMSKTANRDDIADNMIKKWNG